MKKSNYLLMTLLITSLSSCDIEIVLPSFDFTTSDSHTQDYSSSEFIS